MKKKRKKERDKDLQNSTRKAQKGNERLMYETKGVEPNPKGTNNVLEVLTQYNPQTLFEPLILSFIALLPLTMLQAQ